MSNQDPMTRPTTKSIAQYVKKSASKMKKAQMEHHHDGSETVREADYKGCHIVIRTTYKVEVDGVPITGHMGVTDNGQVHYHPVPNTSFPSAIELVKALIDIFPDDFGEESSGSENDGTHGHMHAVASRRQPASKVRRATNGKGN